MKIEIRKLRLLFLYRTIFFKRVTFTSEDKNLETIIKALNIKKRKQKIEFVYDEAIKYIDQYYTTDLCKFKNSQCIVQRQNNNHEVNGCCRICPLVTNKGCPSKNIACKLVYCKTALANLKPLKINNIPILKCLSLRQRLIVMGNFFNTREEILKDINYGVVYSTCRSLKREIQLAVYRRKNKL